MVRQGKDITESQRARCEALEVPWDRRDIELISIKYLKIGQIVIAQIPCLND